MRVINGQWWLGWVASVAVILAQVSEQRPNILWITCEDTGPHLGAYGDRYARTPNLDALAKRGMIYRVAWSNAPVCAPARTAIISGVHAPALGAEHMRSMVRMPPGMKMYPQYLREAGYYCTNNVKEDYNLEKPGVVWDESSTRAHWRNRKPGQPFFAIFNFTTTHESQIRRRPHKLVHDPAQVRLPAYHPDTPEVRHDWAQYYDNITTMDAQAGEILRQLEQDGLQDETIVFFYGDHGPGMPRSKRFPYDSGLRVPLIVYVPPKFRHLAPADYQPGGISQRLVSFVDLAPTVLSLAGIKPPEFMQGRAFMGRYAAPEPQFLYGYRARMDERYDLIRSVRDGRYVYLRNYMPHKIYGQHIAYMFEMPTTQVWQRLYLLGKLRPPQTYFWEPKPFEELYDLDSDPDEVHNLANSPAHRGVLERMRQALDEFILSTRDLGFLPEAEMHARCPGTAPYLLGQDRNRFPLERIKRVADRAASGEPKYTAELVAGLSDRDSAVRYWAVLGLLIRGERAVRQASEQLRALLNDPSPSVRIVAAEALARFGRPEDLDPCLEVLLEHARLDKHGVYVAIEALNALDELDGKAAMVIERIRALPREHSSVHPRLNEYVPRLIEKILQDLQ